MIEGRVAFQAGTVASEVPDTWMHTLAVKLFPRAHRVQKQMDYQNGKTAGMAITFSLEEFRKPQFYILGSFAVSILLLICLGWVGYRLYITHRKLVVAEKTKEHMIYSITHDARQDLSVIQGKMSSLLPKLKNGAQPVNLAKDLRLTMESAEAIERYLNNLKDQQGLVAGRVEIMCEPVCLHEIIVSVTESFEEKMNIRDMEIKVGTLEKNRKVLADLQICKRVLMNLLHNAMKYSPTGGVVDIWQEAREDKLYIYVRDQGQGIPAEDWQRIFQPYMQLDSKKPGMGLGLATARSLVELMDGCLEVAESVVGHGTTFSLTLPWAQGE
jgi:signal transduction histidine kinase